MHGVFAKHSPLEGQLRISAYTAMYSRFLRGLTLFPLFFYLSYTPEQYNSDHDGLTTFTAVVVVQSTEEPPRLLHAISWALHAVQQFDEEEIVSAQFWFSLRGDCRDR